MIIDSEFYYWNTEESHFDNNETMSDFLNAEMDDSYTVNFVDGTYAEITDNHGCRWAVHASGNGDSFNHKVQFDCIGF